MAHYIRARQWSGQTENNTSKLQNEQQEHRNKTKQQKTSRNKNKQQTRKWNKQVTQKSKNKQAKSKQQDNFKQNMNAAECNKETEEKK